MDTQELEASVKNIDERTKRIEQILPTLATKEDLQRFSSKDDLKEFATKDDLKAFATKDDVREEGARTRQHFNAVAERIEARVQAIAEDHDATKVLVKNQVSDVKAELAAHDRRIMKLEAASLKRRR
jgi:glutaredoxin 2